MPKLFPRERHKDPFKALIADLFNLNSNDIYNTK